MLGNERVSHFAFLTKYTVAFAGKTIHWIVFSSGALWDVTFLGDPGEFSLQLSDLGKLSWSPGPCAFTNFFFHA